ncbi:hypothetical protein [Cytophaga aurantiaca]|uniref:hypothetical protein n=1 Tax=Cytophaga aurantiaca TaxID=29530 RepID=UPI000370BF94|nr:hypothetical protein [Cytophaga aurantiaca]
MKYIFNFVFVSTLFIWNSSQAYSQDNENITCIREHKIKARKSYYLSGSADSITALYVLTYMEEYDQQGRQIRWRQYEYADSNKYSDRNFTYKISGRKGAHKRLLDSVGIDKNGFVNYRVLHKLYSEIELEASLKTEIADKSQPIKVCFPNNNKFQVYMVFFYNDKNNITEKRFCFDNDSIFEATFYSYYDDGAIKEIKKIKGTNTIEEIKLFSSTGLLLEEIHYSEEAENEISYKTVYSYNSAGYEIENITSTMVIGMLRPSRRETSEYDGCLKSKTIIYSIDSFSGQEDNYTIVKYRYEYFSK